jgi:hypothetical protein
MNALLTSEIRKVTTLKFWWALAIAPLVVGIFASVITSVIANQLGEFEEDLDISGGVASIGLYVAACSQASSVPSTPEPNSATRPSPPASSPLAAETE